MATLAFQKEGSDTSPLITFQLVTNSIGGSAEGYVVLDSDTLATKYEAASNPGTDNIVVSIADSDTASGLSTTDVVLATSQADLSINTAGADLSLGTSISVLADGSGFAVIWIKITDSSGALGTYGTLKLEINDVLATAI